MKPFFIKVNTGVQLMIVPDSEAHLDGHPVLTYSYSIYRKNKAIEQADLDKMLQLDKKNNPDYLGTIVFEQPDKLFNYVPDGQNKLTSEEVRETIESITEYRDKPQSWSI